MSGSSPGTAFDRRLSKLHVLPLKEEWHESTGKKERARWKRGKGNEECRVGAGKRVGGRIVNERVGKRGKNQEFETGDLP